MNLSAESQNWSKEIRLDSRVTKLENSMAPKQFHGLSFISGEKTEQEVIEQYCAEKGFDVEKFRKEEYGPVIIIEREIIAPKRTSENKHGA
jgi:hypothetical protein